MIDERARHQLYLSLERELGAAEADTMMDLLPPVGWADVATKRDLDALEERIDQRFEMVDKRFEMVDRRFDAMEERIDLRFDAIDLRFDATDQRFDAIDQRFDAMEGRFATKEDLDGAVRHLTRLMVTLMVGMMLTLTTILLAAISLVR